MITSMARPTVATCGNAAAGVSRLGAYPTDVPRARYEWCPLRPSWGEPFSLVRSFFLTACAKSVHDAGGFVWCKPLEAGEEFPGQADRPAPEGYTIGRGNRLPGPSGAAVEPGGCGRSPLCTGARGTVAAVRAGLQACWWRAQLNRRQHPGHREGPDGELMGPLIALPEASPALPQSEGCGLIEESQPLDLRSSPGYRECRKGAADLKQWP